MKQQNDTVEVSHYNAPIGTLTIETIDGAITSLAIDTKSGVHREELKLEPVLKSHKSIHTALDKYFDGTPRAIDTLKIRYRSKPSVLENSVWSALRSTHSGEQLSYKELAKKAGYPRAIRAVASALGRNPHLILTPCHRIVKSDGTLGGFTAGVQVKAYLLMLESRNCQSQL